MTKKIEAIIREERFNDVKDALRKIGIVDLNVTEVRGHGRGGGIMLTGRTGIYQVDLLPRFQFNIVLSDHNVEKTITAIQQAAHAGNKGDDIIFVYPVEEVVRISTEERGHAALMYVDDIDMRDGLEEALPDKMKTGK
jgi:nitrogen regulatory protein P-II 1